MFLGQLHNELSLSHSDLNLDRVCIAKQLAEMTAVLFRLLNDERTGLNGFLCAPDMA